jgi:hypothetical protein
VLLPDGSRKFSMKRIVFSSLIRLTVGFLFLSVAFLNMIQQEAVLSIFYGLLGLLFVEKIDDVVFFVAQQGEAPNIIYCTTRC